MGPRRPGEATLELRLAAGSFVLVEDYASRRDGRPDLSGEPNAARAETARAGA
jgi:hypothetical protein